MENNNTSMITRFFGSIFTTDSLPVAGGGIGALTQTPKLIPWLPTWETVVSTIIITAIGAIVGYLIKLTLDKIFK